MSKILERMLTVKIDGKYVKTAKQVAAHHKFHQNAVYQSRKDGGDKLDKLMLFDEAVEFIKLKKVADEVFMSGSKSGLIDSLTRVMDDEKRYKLELEELEG